MLYLKQIPRISLLRQESGENLLISAGLYLLLDLFRNVGSFFHFFL